MKILLFLSVFTLPIYGETAPAPKPDAETLQIQVQYFQGMLQADEAQLKLAQKQFAAPDEIVGDVFSTVTGGGSNVVPVFFNGTSWVAA